MLLSLSIAQPTDHRKDKILIVFEKHIPTEMVGMRMIDHMIKLVAHILQYIIIIIQ